MIKLICDRCGEEILMQSPKMVRKVMFNYGGTYIKYELCRNCMDEVKKFTKSVKAEDTE